MFCSQFNRQNKTSVRLAATVSSSIGLTSSRSRWVSQVNGELTSSLCLKKLCLGLLPSLLVCGTLSGDVPSGWVSEA